MNLKINKWSQKLKASVGVAHDEVVNYRHKYMKPEHLLLGILEVNDAQVESVIKEQGVNISQKKFQSLVRKTFQSGRQRYPAADMNVQIHIPFSKKSVEIFLMTVKTCKTNKSTEIEPKDLLLGILQSNYRPIKKILNKLKV